jgi:preprotein translocase subunit SecB
MANNDDKQVGIQRIYLKDCSFEAPGTPGTFTRQWKPDINLNVATASKQIPVAGADGEANPAQTGDAWEVTLTLTVEAKVEAEVAFLCEVQQSGLFLLKGLEENERRQVLGSFCPSQLFPYAREAVSDLVGKGGFPQFPLQPINFDALLIQHQRELEKARAEAASSTERH